MATQYKNFKEYKDDALSAKLAEVIKHTKELADMIAAKDKVDVGHVNVRWNHAEQNRIRAIAANSFSGGPCGKQCEDNETCVCVTIGNHTKFCECRRD